MTLSRQKGYVMNVLDQLRAGLLALIAVWLTAIPAAAAVTVVDETVTATQLGSPWVTIRVDDGWGVSDVCAAGFAAGSDWTECYEEFVPFNEVAGNPMYMGPDSYVRLYGGQDYIGPRPIEVNTPTEAAAVVRLGDLLERANPEELEQLREEIADMDGNIEELVSRLDAVEQTNIAQDRRLEDIEGAIENQSGRLDDVENFVTPLEEELGGQSLEEFVVDRVGSAQLTTTPLASWLTGWPWWVPLAVILAVILLIIALVRRSKSKQKDLKSPQYATKADFESLKGKVEDEKTGLAAAHVKIDKTHDLASKAAQESRVATNLNLPDGWTLIGDLPTQAGLDDLDEGDSITMRFLHEKKGERKAVFTKASGAIKNAEGNMVAGLKVAGITGLTKPIALRVTNMIGKVRNGIKSNHFVGVDDKGQTLTQPTAA